MTDVLLSILPVIFASDSDIFVAGINVLPDKGSRASWLSKIK